jgi:hypothetical protein
LHPAPVEVGQLPKKPKFGRKADTIEERNAKIEAYTPEEYNHVYHLLNLKNVEPDFKKGQVLPILDETPFETSEKVEMDGNFWIDTHIFPHICQGVMFSIVEMFIRNKKHFHKRIQKSTVTVLKHGP